MAYNKETEMYEGYIYCITNQINGKKYIGQTRVNIETRWKHHLNYMKRDRAKNTVLYIAMNKYGVENFLIECIRRIECLNKDELLTKLNELEIKYIQEYNTLNIDKFGYNMTVGGKNGSIYMNKPVIKYDKRGNVLSIYNSISEASLETGLSKVDISHCCNKQKSVCVGGYMWSFEGDTYRTDTYIKNRNVIVYDLDGNYIKTLNCLKDINDKQLRHRVQNCCSGYTYNVDDFVYRYIGDDFNKYKVKPERRGGHTKQKCPVIQLDLKGNFINIFNTLKDASKTIGINVDEITKCCKHRIASYKGYIFIYKEEYGGVICN